MKGLSYKDPQFKTWKDTTKAYLERFLPRDSPHLVRFRGLVFMSRNIQTTPWGAPLRPPGYISPDDKHHFAEDCQTAEATIRAALKYIENFGTGLEHEDSPGARRRRATGATSRGGVRQNFYAPVSIGQQAIATDSAVQKIDQMGDTISSSLKEISDLFPQSEDLTPRQVKNGLSKIETLAVEVQKPEDKRNWKSVLDCGQAVLDIADKATDLAQKLAPYTPAIVVLMDKAKHLMQ